MKNVCYGMIVVFILAFLGGIGCNKQVDTRSLGYPQPERDLEEREREKWTGSKKPKTRALEMIGGGEPGDRSGGDGAGGGGGGGGGGHCFASGTRVLMADGALQDIAALQAGDQLLSRDPATGEFRPVAVEKIYHTGQPEHYLINGTLRVTGTHPFMLEQGATRSAAELRPGDVVQGSEGTVTIQSVERIAAQSEVFNLTVSDTHTFFVSGDDKNLFWVHNK